LFLLVDVQATLPGQSCRDERVRSTKVYTLAHHGSCRFYSINPQSAAVLSSTGLSLSQLLHVDNLEPSQVRTCDAHNPWLSYSHG
jgi:hypothetical protein